MLSACIQVQVMFYPPPKGQELKQNICLSMYGKSFHMIAGFFFFF